MVYHLSNQTSKHLESYLLFVHLNLRKDFYLDSNLFNKEMQKRKVVCEGCRKYVKNYDCDNYIYCSEAFARGVKKALTDKEFVKRLLK